MTFVFAIIAAILAAFLTRNSWRYRQLKKVSQEAKTQPCSNCAEHSEAYERMRQAYEQMRAKTRQHNIEFHPEIVQGLGDDNPKLYEPIPYVIVQGSRSSGVTGWHGFDGDSVETIDPPAHAIKRGGSSYPGNQEDGPRLSGPPTAGGVSYPGDSRDSRPRGPRPTGGVSYPG